MLGLDKGGACAASRSAWMRAQEEDTIAYLRAREQVTDVYVEALRPIELLDGSNRSFRALCYLVDPTILNMPDHSRSRSNSSSSAPAKARRAAIRVCAEYRAPSRRWECTIRGRRSCRAARGRLAAGRLRFILLGGLGRAEEIALVYSRRRLWGARHPLGDGRD